jgi:DUF971 family protein
MVETHHLPTEIKLHQRSRMLEILYEDGSHFRLPAEYLRVLSPSAAVRGHSPQTARLQTGKEGVGITELRQIGHYAIKICFDDGHDSGLFDWQYLYRLGQDWQTLWHDYLEQLTKAGYRRNGPDPFDTMSADEKAPS